MARRRQHAPLRVLLNNFLVGHLNKQASGAIEFRYDHDWLDRENAIPVSLSLPLREDAYRGEPVIAVFDNLLPDSDQIRRRVAEKVGAGGTDAYSMLAAIGRDCVGALQFAAGDTEVDKTGAIDGEPVNDDQIEHLLNNLAQAPLGLNRDDDFRISVAGAQEKTALLRFEGQWLKPRGTTATSHIFKTQIGHLPNGIDLTDSVENEFLCLHLLKAFGLPVNTVEMAVFGDTKALVIERFDRRWTATGRLLRLPQEDCCQALSVPPTRKYQADRGPGMVQILDLLRGSNTPAEDQKTFLKAQILFWLIGATDGHAKNFSVFLGSGGTYQMTPLYDVLSAQPSLDARQIERKQMRMAMSFGDTGHYRFDEIHARHIMQTASSAGLSQTLITTVIDEIVASVHKATESVTRDFAKILPSQLLDSVASALSKRQRLLSEHV